MTSNNVYSKTSDKGHSERGTNLPTKDKLKVLSLYRKSPLKEDNLSTKDKTTGPEGVLIKRFHCTSKLLTISFKLTLGPSSPGCPTFPLLPISPFTPCSPLSPGSPGTPLGPCNMKHLNIQGGLEVRGDLPLAPIIQSILLNHEYPSLPTQKKCC